ncbi:hypothetical protein [Pontibacter vulgaris]|uniref:hypothetical protein n=1 Tax=Pontibacter vulgaris TaxID=2905679 RepID=UPI001FA6E577|nr:hypothetical protein [Pontibacter vulgaris]
MKKKKDPTEPIACRVSPEQREQLLQEADEIGLSLAEYVAMLVTMAMYEDTNIEKLRDQMNSATAEQLKQLQTQIAQEQGHVWNQKPYASMLQTVLRNDAILATLYEEYFEKPFPANVLKQAGYEFNFMLQGANIDQRIFYFTGRFGWAFTDAKSEQVTLKRNG